MKIFNLSVLKKEKLHLLKLNETPNSIKLTFSNTLWTCKSLVAYSFLLTKYNNESEKVKHLSLHWHMQLLLFK